jgi:hypothetical protein
MIKCPYCGSELPNKLPNCPACRNPIPGGTIPSIVFEGDLPLPHSESKEREYDLDAGSAKRVHDLDAPGTIPASGHGVKVTVSRQVRLRKRRFDLTDMMPRWEPTGRRGDDLDPSRLLTKTQIGDVLIGIAASLVFMRFWPWGLVPGAVVGSVLLFALQRYREITWGAVGGVLFVMGYLALGLTLSGSLGGGN